MSKYSFLLQGQEPEYFELLPALRLQKYGGWLVAEAIEQEEAGKAQSQATIRAVQLAKRIASSKGIALDEAFEILQSGTGLSEIELLDEFTEETLAMISSGGSIETSNARMVTTFIRCRGEALIGDAWARVDDWSMDDTKAMGRRLIAKTMEFIGDEQQAEVEESTAKKIKTTKASLVPKT